MNTFNPILLTCVAILALGWIPVLIFVNQKIKLDVSTTDWVAREKIEMLSQNCMSHQQCLDYVLNGKPGRDYECLPYEGEAH